MSCGGTLQTAINTPFIRSKLMREAEAVKTVIVASLSRGKKRERFEENDLHAQNDDKGK